MITEQISTSEIPGWLAGMKAWEARRTGQRSVRAVMGRSRARGLRLRYASKLRRIRAGDRRGRATP